MLQSDPVVSGDHLVPCRVCSKVVEGGVLSDSALWLARQLGQGQLSTPAAARLAGSLHAVFRGALRGLAQLFSGGGQPEGSHEVPPNLVALMADLHRASEAALGAGVCSNQCVSCLAASAPAGGKVCIHISPTVGLKLLSYERPTERTVTQCFLTLPPY